MTRHSPLAALILFLAMALELAAGSRGVRLSWHLNPPDEDVLGYRIFVGQGTNLPPAATNYYVAGALSTNLVLPWLDKEARTNELVWFHLPWASTNRPARLIFTVTAMNAYGESDHSLPAPLALSPVRVEGMRVIELQEGKPEASIAWSNFPPWFVVDYSLDAIEWCPLFELKVRDGQAMPFQLDFVWQTTNRPASFYRRIELEEP